MREEEVAIEAVKSPCVSVCTLDATGKVCLGCGRLISEIAQWSTASEARRGQIVEAASARMGSLTSLQSPGTR